MKDFPTELLPQIFILLPQEDQLECMLTCQLWKSIIEQFCLFRTLRIESVPFLEKCLEKIKENPTIGSHVRELRLNILEEIDTSEFLQKLPYLRKLYTLGPDYGDLQVKVDSPFPWINCIESIEDNTCQTIVRHLLSTSLCPNLTELSFYSRGESAVPLLKNAPALKRLKFISENFDFNDINQIHETLQHLKTLEIKESWISGDGYEENVTPAYSLTKLTIVNAGVSSLEVQINLLNFIAKKYPNLVELGHELYYRPEDEEEKDRLNRYGWEPLFETLGHQLKGLYTAHTDQFYDLPLMLYNHKCHIQHLKIHNLPKDEAIQFIHPQLTSYIRTLTLKTVQFTSMEWLSELESLESLEIEQGEYDTIFRMDFNDIVNNAPPTLETLKLQNIILKVNINSATQCNIRNLSFSECNVPGEAGRFIDRHFPRIANLKFKNCRCAIKQLSLRSAELESFYYINSRRDYVSYDYYRNSDNELYYVLIRTVEDDRERLYSLKKELYYSTYSMRYRRIGEVDYPAPKPLPEDELNKHKIRLDLCCYSVKKLVIL